MTCASRVELIAVSSEAVASPGNAYSWQVEAAVAISYYQWMCDLHFLWKAPLRLFFPFYARAEEPRGLLALSYIEQTQYYYLAGISASCLNDIYKITELMILLS